MRQPRVQNKYNLKFSDIGKMIVIDREALTKKPFWRNNVINAWCLSETTEKSNADSYYCTYNEYWIGFYDMDAPSYKGKVKCSCSAYGGMCSYKFKTFYNIKDIETELDLEIQEKLLERLNWLLDNKIVMLKK